MISPTELLRWCSIPASELSTHPESVIPVEVVDSADDVYRVIADEMFGELAAKDAAGKLTRWIVPCGPMGQYPLFADLVNASTIDMTKVHIFHMDDFLDWQARPLPDTHPLSFRRAMLRDFYGLLDGAHRIPENNRHFPDVYSPDSLSAAISEVGGVDTVWGGIGYRGHVAFNEPPRSPWHVVTAEQYAQSKTRVVVLNDDTMIAMSQRTAGGLSQIIPPFGITIGMADMIAAARVRLFSTTGSWKQAVIRVAVFSRPSVDYPVTLFAGHPDVSIVVDAITATAPLAGLDV